MCIPEFSYPKIQKPVFDWTSIFDQVYKERFEIFKKDFPDLSALDWSLLFVTKTLDTQAHYW